MIQDLNNYAAIVKGLEEKLKDETFKYNLKEKELQETKTR